VTNLTPAGAEPHDLELIPDQVDHIQNADVVFVMGHGFQPALEKAAGQRDGPTVKLLDHVPNRAGDPHVWLDPDHYSRLVDEMTVALVKAHPKCTATFRKNARRYQAEIARVGGQYADGLRDCKRRTIVTAHEAFGYLATRYGLIQKGITGIAPDQEPDAQRMGELASFVRQHHVTTIFTETLVSPRVADALAREAGGVRTATLNPLEGLTDKEVARGDDWASVMRANLRKLEAALGCGSAR
jgi:zinc transport system substrate-binding protein